ncbi:hypothetical protein ACIP6X_24070 [Streptomyces coeruleorubidus]|uniref:hypothetical protein n=1 Tax=Streptomyces coeruleorubidus TaxID=116188 RepID=UPI00380A9AE2
MTGSTPPWKRRFSKRKADEGPIDGPQDGARDDERGSTSTGAASLEPAADRGDLPASVDVPAPVDRTAGTLRERAMDSARKGSVRARAGLAHLADRIIELAPRVPVRDLATLRRQFPGLGPEELADKLVAGAAKATATVGAGIGAAAMLPVPPAMPTELAAEITGVAAIELKLIAELHEVYGVRPPGNLKQRSTAYLHSWSGERGIDATKPATLSTALNSRMKRDLRQRIMKRMVRSMPNLVPFLIGAAVGAAMNRSETRKLAVRIREDLRRIQVPWDALEPLPALERPADALEMGEITDDPLGRLANEKSESGKRDKRGDGR